MLTSNSYCHFTLVSLLQAYVRIRKKAKQVALLRLSTDFNQSYLIISCSFYEHKGEVDDCQPFIIRDSGEMSAHVIPLIANPYVEIVFVKS